MLYRLIAFVGIALVIFACDTKEGTPVDPVVEVKFDSVEVVKAKIDGVDYEGTPTGPATVTSPSAGSLFFTTVSVGTSGVFTMSATVADTGKGEYVLGSGAAGTMGFTISGKSYVTSNGATGTLFVDKIDVTLKRIKGRFNGTTKNSADEQKIITEGTFEIKW